MCSVVRAAILATITATDAAPPNPVPLPIAPGAEDVHSHAAEGVLSVEYDVKEAYPAAKTMEYLILALRERGWAFRDFRASKPSAQTATPLPQPAHLWEGWWRDRAGNEIAFTMASKCPMDRFGMHSLYVHVVGVKYGKEEAARREARREAEQKKRQRESCEALLRIVPSQRPNECEQ